MNRTLLVVVAASLLSGSAWAQSKAGASRVDFDDQLVQGQVNKGAVHLIERKDSNLGSLVKKRTSYRKEILAGTDVRDAKPVAAVAALPAALPVVKAADLKGDAIEPVAAPAPAKAPAAPAASASKGAPATKAAPAAKSAPAAKPAPKKGAEKKSPAKSETKQSTKNGGSRVVSRR